VYDAADRYLGCCYLYPMGRRTALTPELVERDVDVSWWVTPDAYDRGYYTKLYFALQRWVADDFPFARPYYSNREIPTTDGQHRTSRPVSRAQSRSTPAGATADPRPASSVSWPTGWSPRYDRASARCAARGG
jgi:hypothetical protein